MEKKQLLNLIKMHPLFKVIYKMGVDTGRKDVLKEELIRLKHKRHIINN